jgi:hypothetical protein
MTDLVTQKTKASKTPVNDEEKHKTGLKRGAIGLGVGAGASVLMYEAAIKRKARELMKKNPNMSTSEALERARALVGKKLGRTALLAGIGAAVGKMGSDKLAEKSNDEINENKAKARVTQERYVNKHPVKKIIGKLQGKSDEEMSKEFMGKDIKYLKKHATDEDLEKFYKAQNKQKQQTKLQEQAARKKASNSKTGPKLRLSIN